jgi:hypothetical protein
MVYKYMFKKKRKEQLADEEEFSELGCANAKKKRNV